MQSLVLTSGDAGYIDPADPAAIDPADSRYVRAELAAVPAYYDRIRAEAETSAEPDDLAALRRRTGRCMSLWRLRRRLEVVVRGGPAPA